MGHSDKAFVNESRKFSIHREPLLGLSLLWLPPNHSPFACLRGLRRESDEQVPGTPILLTRWVFALKPFYMLLDIFDDCLCSSSFFSRPICLLKRSCEGFDKHLPGDTPLPTFFTQWFFTWEPLNIARTCPPRPSKRHLLSCFSLSYLLEYGVNMEDSGKSKW